MKTIKVPLNLLGIVKLIHKLFPTGIAGWTLVEGANELTVYFEQ